jgi:hypothetical protein
VARLLSRRTDQWTPSDRVVWLRVTLALASLAGLLLSAKLWLSARWYPLTPISAALPAIPPPIDLWLFLLLVLLAVAVVVSGSRWIALAFVGLLTLLCLWDQSRWQPWVYQYAFMLVALAIAPGGASRLEQAPQVLATCRVIVASLYVWSGLQKLNAGFALEVVPYLAAPLIAWLPAAGGPVSWALGGLIALFEVGVGSSLLMRRTRQWAVLGAAVMHVAIIATLGPWGKDWNRVILPWNVGMIALVVVLFWRIGDVTARDIILPARALLPLRGALAVRAVKAQRADASGRHQAWAVAGALAPRQWRAEGPRVFHAIVLVLFGVMPLLSFVDAWDSYLSWSLYSGNTRRADLVIAEASRQAIPSELWRYTDAAAPDWHVLAFETWAMGELGVPPYPEERIFLNVARGVCAYGGTPAGVWLRISGKPGLLTGVRQAQVYACSGLAAGR